MRAESEASHVCSSKWAMAKWRRRATAFDCGIDLHDGTPKCLDLRFADDIFPFAPSAHETTVLLDLLAHDLVATGLLFALKWAGHSGGT